MSQELQDGTEESCIPLILLYGAGIFGTVGILFQVLRGNADFPGSILLITIGLVATISCIILALWIHLTDAQARRQKRK